jgi:hypothetical protein
MKASSKSPPTPRKTVTAIMKLVSARRERPQTVAGSAPGNRVGFGWRRSRARTQAFVSQ